MSELVRDFIDMLGKTIDQAALRELLLCFSQALGLSHFALVTHEDLRVARDGQVDIREYPAAISERIIDQALYRRDPVMRGCVFADSAFLWSGLKDIIVLDRHDQAILDLGSLHGLSEGITVPCPKFGAVLGSCTFAGAISTLQARRLIEPLHMVGIFAFQRARRIVGGKDIPVVALPRLNPRPRDCVVLAGRGQSNKQIARSLALAPRTVDGYLANARRSLGAADRTEMVIAAVLDGQVGLEELRDRQSRSFHRDS